MIGARLILITGATLRGSFSGPPKPRRAKRFQRHKGAPDQGSSSILKLRAYHLCVSHPNCGIAPQSSLIGVSGSLDGANSAAGPKDNLVLNTHDEFESRGHIRLMEQIRGGINGP